MQVTEEEKKLLKFANDTPEVLSCLYDLNLLPEVIGSVYGEKAIETREWCMMLIIIEHFKICHDRLCAANGHREGGG